MRKDLSSSAKRKPFMSRSSTVAAVTATVVAVVLAGGSASAARPPRKPAAFHAQSVSWVSPEQGWMLGAARCGSDTCTTVVGTSDSGRIWKRLATLDAPLTLEEETGVTQIRFADDLHGWAFEPALWATADGGATWREKAPPGHGHLVLGLAGNADAVYALVSPCKLNHLCTDPVGLWRTTPGLGSWTRVPLTLPAFSGFNLAVLAVHGPVAYLDIPTPGSYDSDVLDVTVDGQSWSSRPDPCNKTNGEYLSSVAPISDSKVALLCQSDIGFGKAAKRVFRSNDTGQTTTSAGTLPIYGIVNRLAATPNGTLVVSSFSIGSWIYRNAGGQTWTTSVDLGDGGMGWNDLVFTTDQVGYVIHGPAASPWLPGELWKTEDGGVTWGGSVVAPS